MREFVPVDIYKTTLGRMIEQGLTPAVAARIWTNKALWLICTHKEDIAKVPIVTNFGIYCGGCRVVAFHDNLRLCTDILFI